GGFVDDPGGGDGGPGPGLGGQGKSGQENGVNGETDECSLHLGSSLKRQRPAFPSGRTERRKRCVSTQHGARGGLGGTEWGVRPGVSSCRFFRGGFHEPTRVRLAGSAGYLRRCLPNTG